MSDPLVGRTVKHYQLTKLIGTGGFGNIYQAIHLRLNKFFAFKVLHRHHTANEEIVRRFESEAKVLSSLNHINIIQLIDFDFDEVVGHYIVLEWLEGETLKSLLQREKSLSPETTYALFEQILKGLYAAHQHNVVHRDLSPANIMLIPTNRAPIVKILDFGIALFNEAEIQRQTMTGTILGSAKYMAPEQALGEIYDIDHRSDLYSCGMLLAKCLTGNPPFYRGASTKIMLDKLNAPLPSLGELAGDRTFSPELEAVFAKAAAIDKNQRFQSAMEFLQALRDAIQPRDDSYSFMTLSLKVERAQMSTSNASQKHSFSENSEEKTSVVSNESFGDLAEEAIEEDSLLASLFAQQESSASSASKYVLPRTADANMAQNEILDIQQWTEENFAPQLLADEDLPTIQEDSLSPDLLSSQRPFSKNSLARQKKISSALKQKESSLLDNWPRKLAFIVLFFFTAVLAIRFFNLFVAAPEVSPPPLVIPAEVSLKKYDVHIRRIVKNRSRLTLLHLNKKLSPPLASAFSRDGEIFWIGLCRGQRRLANFSLQCGVLSLYFLRFNIFTGEILHAKILARWEEQPKYISLLKYSFALHRLKSGHFVFSGLFFQNFPLATPLHANALAFFILKIDEKGELLWRHSFGNFAPKELQWHQSIVPFSEPALKKQHRFEIRPLLIASNRYGEIFLAGHFTEKIFFPKTILSPRGQEDIFLLKYSAEGDLCWSLSFGGRGHDKEAYLIEGFDDAVYLTGSFERTLYVSKLRYRSRYKKATFLIAIDKKGKILWTKNLAIQPAFKKDGAPRLMLGRSQVDKLVLSGSSLHRMKIQGRYFSSKKPRFFLIVFNKLGYALNMAPRLAHPLFLRKMNIISQGEILLTGEFNQTAVFGKHQLSIPQKGLFLALLRLEFDSHLHWDWAMAVYGDETLGFYDLYLTENHASWLLGSLVGQGHFGRRIDVVARKPSFFFWRFRHPHSNSQQRKKTLSYSQCPKFGTFLVIYPKILKSIKITSDQGPVRPHAGGFCIPAPAKEVFIRQKGFHPCRFQHSVNTERIEVYLFRRHLSFWHDKKYQCRIRFKTLK